MSTSYNHARFWKCALQVNPEGYSRAYRGQDQGLNGDDYLKALLRACQEADIEVVGIADHGSVSDVDSIRNFLSPHGILVFPGFEIATTEKVHWVCLFDERTTTEQLNRYLGVLRLTDPEDGVRPSKLGGEELLRIVEEECDGFCYAAHVTHDSGLLKQKANHLWKSARLRAAQIPGPIEDLPCEYKPIVRNQNPDYQRETELAIINAKDVARPEDLLDPSASCYIKMTRPTFASFLTAFMDPGSRVRLHHQMAESHYGRIKRLTIAGGYFEQVTVDFSDHLNTAIGGRGTGKSTLLECVRYALDVDYKGIEARRLGEQILKANLGGAGRVELEVISAANQGQRYRVVRRYGEPPRVLDAAGNVSNLHPGRDLFPSIEIYGQNEIHELAREASALTRILERFLPPEAKQAPRLVHVRKRLTENAVSLERAWSNQDDLEQIIERLPKLTEQAAQFKALGIDEQLKQVPLLEKERQLKPRMDEEVQRIEDAARILADSLPDPAFLSDKALTGLPHAALLGGGREILDALKVSASKSLDELRAAAATARAGLSTLGQDLATALDIASQALEAEFAKLPDVAGRGGAEVGRAYQSLLREIEQIQPRKTGLDAARKLTESLEQERRNLLGELSDLRTLRTQALQTAAKRLNRRLRGKLRIQVIPGGNRAALKTWLCALPGINDKRAGWIEEVEDPSIPTLVEAIRQGEEVLRGLGWGMTSGMVEKLARLSHTQLLGLEVIDLEDQIDLQLNVSHDGELYRSLHELSTGQQCTTILHLLLLENPDPLIMDQPEDNLDNAFIAERIVRELRDAKTHRQFIFATHNANIPVFGDAEWIGVFTATEDHGLLGDASQGSIDVPEIRDQAARILEGGKAAFIQRQAKYGY
ncbi:TrlF family AAA-like ATPase [Thiocystis violacea]|uniref:TrlF family AAA-like ATPase n=1 Tax=Thiocystis violacea TaxID=13725 RepID=UPI001F5BC4C0|nr:AAA family ATPase [Thiocystis violacea]MBK1717207.1 ATPase [Thiocystis violacea]